MDFPRVEFRPNKKQCKEGYIISVKWLLQMELFIDEYLKFFEIRNEHNSDKSFGKYKRTKTDRVFDEFMSKMFDISKIKESIVNEGDNFNIPNKCRSFRTANYQFLPELHLVQVICVFHLYYHL